MLVFGAAREESCEGGSNQAQQERVTEAYSQKLTTAQPYPLEEMNDSTERANLKERLLRMNNPNKIGYVYELTNNGQVVAAYTIKGKVSSTQSQMTNTQEYVYSGAVVDTMSDDGSYGPNEDGVFFFTTSGTLVQWNGLYQYSDAPLQLLSKPLMVMNVGKK